MLTLTLLALLASASPASLPIGTASNSHAILSVLTNGVSPTALRTPDAADEAAQYIAGLYEGELYEMVVKEAESFLSKYKNHADRAVVLYRLASALFELDRPGDAIPHYQQLAGQKRFEYRAESQLRLGQCELSSDRPKSARSALRAALASDQDYLKPTAAFFLGEAEFRLKRYAEAREQYEASLRADSAAAYHAHARRGLAWSYFLEGNWAASQTHSRTFLSNYATHELAPEVQFLLGDAAFQAESFDAAERAWSAIDSGEWHEAALRGRAWIRSKRGEHGDSAIFFARLLEANAKGRFAQEAALQCGVHLLRAGNQADALRVLELPAVGKTPESLYWHARALRETGQEQAALKLLENGARTHRGDSEGDWQGRLQTLRADILFDLGRLEEAAQSYQEDGSEYGLHAGATASLNGGQPEHALELADQFLKQFPESPYRNSTRLVRAEACFMLQDYARALSDLQQLSQAKDLSPAQASNVQSRLAWCQYLLGDVQTSAKSFARVRPDSTEAQEASYMVGRAHSESGNVQAAIESWTRFLQQYPAADRRPEVQLSLSRLTGDPDLIRQLLRENPEHATVPGALMELAEFESQAGRPQQAIAHYRDYLRRFPQAPMAPHARYSLCWELRASGDVAGAERELAPLLDTRSRSSQEAPSDITVAALELGIWIASESQDPQAAAPLWKRFAPRCTDEQKLLEMGRLMADTWSAAGEPVRAKAQLAALAERLRDPELSFDLLLDRAWLAIENESVKESGPLVQQAVRRAPEDPRVLELSFFAAEKFYDAKEYMRAAELYAAAAHPANGDLVDEALYKLGFTYLALDQPRQAAEGFERLVQDYPRSELRAESLYLAGEARFRADDAAGAFELLRQFQKSIRRHTARPKALHRLGLVANALGHHKTANEALTELLTTNPEFGGRAEVRYEQGIALVGLDRKRAARTAFNALLKETQNSDTDGLFTARARIELGRMDMEAKSYEDALSQFLKVSLLYAEGEEVREAKWLSAQVLEAQGEQRLAIKNYRELQDSAPKTPQGQAAAKRLRELGA